MARWTFINNEFKKEEEALVSYRDLSIQRGYGLFEFLGIREGRLLFWEDHYQRLQNSASTLHLPITYDSVKLKEIIAELLLRNGTGKHEGIRITLTGGNADDGYSLSHPNLIISQTSFTPPSAGQVKKGISLITWDHRRQLPRVKSIDYLMALWLQPLIKEKGADDVLYHHNGSYTECPRSNIFILSRDGDLITPAEDVLEGVTRMKVLQLASRHCAVRQKAIGFNDLFQAREVFITSTTKMLLPVSEIDGHRLPDNRPLSTKLREDLEKLLKEQHQTV